MAEALLGVVLDNLSTFVQNKLATFWGVKREIERLSNSLTLIQAVLEDAEQKQITNPSIRVWLQQLKDAAHVLDDILDHCSIQSLRLEDKAQDSGSTSQVCCVSLSSFKPKNTQFRYEIGNRLKEITERLDRIAKDRKKFVLIEYKGMGERPIEVAEWRQTSSVMAQREVYGRDKDKEKIVEFLVNQISDCDDLSIYPIVGMGGLGKTTLAQWVFNDQRVSKHFNLTIWVCVSDDFTMTRILRSIIEYVTKQGCTTLNLDTMQKKVQELLQSKRYLLVLDDVWNKNQDKWDQLRSVLACGSSGASVLVTTRDSNIASIMGTHPAHHLSCLSEDDCWSLFKQRAFASDREERAELVAIGKEIVRKCGGLPLAAKALGSLMRFKSEEKQWLEVKESELWHLPNEDSILPALRLSYISLTPTLRQCFAFCAIFPKNKVIEKEDLIHLWMANGFISSRKNLDVENVGNEIWNELYHKSFFQDVMTNNYGNTSFKMHDLVHDLAQSVMGKECLFLENEGLNDLSTSTHHISCSSSELSFNKEDLEKVESLRTLILLLNFNNNCVFGGFPTHCSIRALTINSVQLPSLDYLIHLRYLALYSLMIDAIPNSICSLRKLEILKLGNCEYLHHLPEGLTRLQNLRHLIIIPYLFLTSTPPNIGKLPCLRTLSVFIVESDMRHSLAELCNLNLGGKLSIELLKNVGSVSEAKRANLIAKKDLQELSLSWLDERKIQPHGVDIGQVIEALQPHSNLKRLRVSAYEGSHFPSWMRDVSALSSLVSLQLNSCKNCLQLSALGKLPCLKNLEIDNMQYVQYMDDESYDGMELAFLSLETLTLSDMPNLERLLKKEAGEMFSRLSTLSIDNCPKLRLPCLPSVEDLSLSECEEELLRSVSSFRGLTYLSLSGNEELTSLPEGIIRNLTYLKSLDISYFSKLKELPIELMNLHTLEELCIAGCDQLELISEQALEGLCSLQTLTIHKCEGLKSLPEAIRHLTSLELLHIWRCPILVERCKEGTGEDWHKVQHIPHLRVL